MGTIRKGSPRPNRRATKIYGIGTFDYNGLYTVNEIKVCYYVWKDMLKRATKAYQEKHKSYVGVSVCKEWLSFNNFKAWFDVNYKPNFTLDKDILSRADNKVYSPDTCCFIPQELNKAIMSRITKPTALSNGVRLTPNGKYQARLFAGRKYAYLGLYDKQEDAHKAYKDAKELYVHNLAKEYFITKQINEKIYIALLNWHL